MKLNFYVVKNQNENQNENLKPFILVSKYNLQKIKEMYSKFNKKMPNIEYLFKEKNNKKTKKTTKKTKKKIKQKIPNLLF
jgi:hypothetical protein